MQPERKLESTARVGQRQGKKDRGEVVSISSGGGMIWRGPDYPLLDPGKYVVRGVKGQGPEWVRSFQRWSIRIEFALVAEPGYVSAFYNFGTDRDARYIGRQSRYFKAWSIANGGMPRKGQDMAPDIFLEGQFFEVVVENCDTDSKGNQKADAEVYSRITAILRAWTP